MLNLGQPEQPWEVPPARRTFKPGPPPARSHPWQESITGEFEAVSNGDISHRCITLASSALRLRSTDRRMLSVPVPTLPQG